MSSVTNYYREQHDGVRYTVLVINIMNNTYILRLGPAGESQESRTLMNPFPRRRPRKNDSNEPSNARGSLMYQLRMSIVQDISSMKYQISGHRTDLFTVTSVGGQLKIVSEAEDRRIHIALDHHVKDDKDLKPGEQTGNE